MQVIYEHWFLTIVFIITLSQSLSFALKETAQLIVEAKKPKELPPKT